jgi:polyhydroxyalkanoate synthase subunit PhaC
MSALNELPAARIRRGMEVLATAPRPPVGLTPNEVVHQQGRLTVRYYAPAAPARATPIVLVPSLINRAYILDLEPGRSLVQALAAAGHPTYLVDWGVPHEENGGEDVAFTLRMLRRSIDRACRHAGAPQAILFGYCMGGTLAAMLAARSPTRVAALVALAAPVRFAAGGRFASFVAGLDARAAFPAEALVPVSTMKPAFQMLDPVGNVSKHLAIEAASHDAVKLARVLARERWLEENVPLPGAFAAEFVREGYQRDGLWNETWSVEGEPVRLAAIRVPTLVVTCARDFITPEAAAAPLAERVGAHGRHVSLDTGHIGVVVGAEGPRRFYPLLDRFCREVAP